MYINVNGWQIPVRIIEEKSTYGRPRVLIEPTGEAATRDAPVWVDAGRVQEKKDARHNPR